MSAQNIINNYDETTTSILNSSEKGDNSKTVISNLGDPNNPTNSVAGDTVSTVKDVARNYFSAVRMKTPIEPQYRYNKFPKFNTLPKMLSMDFSRILNKPFYITSVPWTTSNTVGTTFSYNIPGSILTNKLAEIPFDAATYYRAKVEFVLQVSGTPMHQGTLIAAALPARYSYVDDFQLTRNLYMSAPHVFMSANESTPVVLEVPFYVNSKLAAIDLDNTGVRPGTNLSSYAQVKLAVWNQLIAPTSGSTAMTVSIHIVFRELEFYAPHVDPTWESPSFMAEGFIQDIKNLGTRSIDGMFSTIRTISGDLLDTTKLAANSALGSAREWIRSYTGLHAPEIPFLGSRNAVQTRQNLNLVDSPSYFEKLDPYGHFTHSVDDYVFDTDIDEMSVKEIITKPMYIGSFDVNVSDEAGKLLFSRPISPIQSYTETSNFTSLGLAPSDTLTYASSSLIQTLALLSKYWRGGLKIHLQSVMSNFHFCKLVIARNYSPSTNMKTKYPAYRDVTNFLTESIEFSAGGQVQTISMPYLSLLEQLPCSPDLEMNALEHGMYYIYLYQPLVTNGSASTSISFNVYVSADDDFDFMGYATNPLVLYKPLCTVAGLVTNDDKDFVAEATAPTPVNSQDPVVLTKHFDENTHHYDMRPIKNVRDYIRRFNKIIANRVLNINEVTDEGTIVIPVSQLLDLKPQFGDEVPTSPHGEIVSPLHILSNMFMGYVGGTKFKILINGSTISEAWYVPPTFSLSQEGLWMSTDPINTAKPSLTAILREQYKFPDVANDINLVNTESFISPTVSIERPNYFNMQSGTLMTAGATSTSTEATSMSTAILEFEVPYMSPFRFVGDANKTLRFSAAAGIPQRLYPGVSDMGHIILKLGVPFGYNPGTGLGPLGLTYEVFVAATDEARFGYQVFAPIVGPAAYKLSLIHI